MKRYNYCMRVVMIEIIVWLLPCFALAGRKDSSCDIFVLTEKWCSNVSNNYTQPYCVTNFYHEDRHSSDVNYAERCIVPAITNKLSSNNWQSLWSASKWEAIQLFCKTLLWCWCWCWCWFWSWWNWFWILLLLLFEILLLLLEVLFLLFTLLVLVFLLS